MKAVWEEGDIVVGRYFYRGDSPNAEIGYLASVTHKIGFMAGGPSKHYVSISVTDGMVTDPVSAAEFATRLNDGGYVPVSSDRLVQIIAHLRSQNEGRGWQGA